VGQAGRIEIKATAMEIDGNLEVIRISVAEGPLLDGGDLGIQTLGDCVRDAVLEIGSVEFQVDCRA
jgi:hypothetical protein